MCRSLIVCFLFPCSASFPEAGEAPLQSHTSHPGRQGGHEGQSLRRREAFPRCAHVCAKNHFNIVPDNWLRVSRHSGWSSLTSPDRPHCEEDQKYNTTPPTLSTRTLHSSRRAETSQPRRLDSESGVVPLCSKVPSVAVGLGWYLTKKMPSSM